MQPLRRKILKSSGIAGLPKSGAAFATWNKTAFEAKFSIR